MKHQLTIKHASHLYAILTQTEEVMRFRARALHSLYADVLTRDAEDLYTMADILCVITTAMKDEIRAAHSEGRFVSWELAPGPRSTMISG